MRYVGMRAVRNLRLFVGLIRLKYMRFHCHEGEKILIVGYGRSGSTLLAKILAGSNLYDLGEPLRLRKTWKHSWMFRKSASEQLEAFALRQLSQKKIGVVAHLKPWHSYYWGEHWTDTVREARENGWVVIGLRREFSSMWRSELRARARGLWVGDLKGETKIEWWREHDWSSFVAEFIEFHRFDCALSGLFEQGLLWGIIDYYCHLHNEKKQKSLLTKLKSDFPWSSLDKVTTKHKISQVDNSVAAQKLSCELMEVEQHLVQRARIFMDSPATLIHAGQPIYVSPTPKFKENS